MYNTLPSIFNDDFFTDFDDMFKNSRLSYMESFPPTNIFFGENGSVTLELATAGYKKEELSVSVDRNKITLEGNPEPEDERVGKFYHQKIKKCQFKRVYSLPDGVYDFDKSTVSYENGLLTIVIPKKEELKAVQKKLEIK